MTAPISIEVLNDALIKQFAPWVLQLNLAVVRADESGVALTIQPSEQTNRDGAIVCGQALMAAADTAMVIAVYAATGRTTPCATVDINTSFLKPATNVQLTAHAQLVRLGRSMAFARVLIDSSRDGKSVASATATYALPPA